MDVANLRAFLAVAESGSFSSASAQLYLTQPAISKRVATLAYLGHVNLSGTQTYLTMTHELLAEASKRFERYTAIGVKEQRNV